MTDSDFRSLVHQRYVVALVLAWLMLSTSFTRICTTHVLLQYSHSLRPIFAHPILAQSMGCSRVESMPLVLRAQVMLCFCILARVILIIALRLFQTYHSHQTPLMLHAFNDFHISASLDRNQ